jgi:hypothetical protein
MPSGVSVEVRPDTLLKERSNLLCVAGERSYSGTRSVKRFMPSAVHVPASAEEPGLSKLLGVRPQYLP